MIEKHLKLKTMNLEKTTTIPQLIKVVLASGDVNEMNKLIEQFKNISYDVFGEQVSLYEMYKNYFTNHLDISA